MLNVHKKIKVVRLARRMVRELLVLVLLPFVLCLKNVFVHMWGMCVFSQACLCCVRMCACTEAHEHVHGFVLAMPGGRAKSSQDFQSRVILMGFSCLMKVFFSGANLSVG